MSERETLLEFPCQFPIKAMGPAGEEFETHVRAIFERHIPAFSDELLHQRASSNGRYISITVTFEATSQGQLDAIYEELSASELVMMAL